MAENVTISREEYLDLLESKLELFEWIENETTSFISNDERKELKRKIKETKSSHKKPETL
jgi:hypothetical protein